VFLLFRSVYILAEHMWRAAVRAFCIYRIGLMDACQVLTAGRQYICLRKRSSPFKTGLAWSGLARKVLVPAFGSPEISPSVLFNPTARGG
jgi:hypothetical protein